jgi:L-alanine-DL-glutamate epimerase-like enolase superfamily enzyme
MDLIYAYQEWPYRETFRISRSASSTSDLFFVALRDGDLVGRGECGILPQYGDSAELVRAEFERARPLLAAGLDRQALSRSDLNSSVRNALDAALWDLECQRTGRDIWTATSIARPNSLEVDLTISIATPEKMSADARRAVADGYRLLKLKADAHSVLPRVQAIAQACPGVGLIVDANEAWDLPTLRALDGPLADLCVELIEQPLPHGRDQDLATHRGRIPLSADESCRHLADLADLTSRYQAINIKLDKVGGLTPALDLARAAKGAGLKLMVGCSGPTSLGAAPAFVLGALADYLDLDGPALLLEDRAPAMRYENGRLLAFEPKSWGG